MATHKATQLELPQSLAADAALMSKETRGDSSASTQLVRRPRSTPLFFQIRGLCCPDLSICSYTLQFVLNIIAAFPLNNDLASRVRAILQIGAHFVVGSKIVCESSFDCQTSKIRRAKWRVYFLFAKVVVASLGARGTCHIFC